MKYSSIFTRLRSKLLLLVLSTVLPALGVIIYLGIADRDHFRSHAYEDAFSIACQAANLHKQLIDEKLKALYVLSQVPEIQNLDTNACTKIFAAMVEQSSGLKNVGICRPNGDLFITARPVSVRTINVADQSWFQHILNTHRTGVSGYQTGYITGKAVIYLGYPILDQKGRLKAVISTALDLNWLKQVMSGIKLPEGATLNIMDDKGITLLRFPEPEKYLGKHVANVPFISAIMAKKEGVIEAQGIDGVPRLFGFTSYANSPGITYVRVGIPKEVAFAEADKKTIRNIAALGIITIIILLVTRAIGGSILRPIDKLINATEQMKEGDLSARANIVDCGFAEARCLSDSFDKMADTLEQHNKELKESEIKLRTAHHQIELILNSTGEGILGLDIEGKHIFVNPSAARMLGYKVEELIGLPSHEIWHHSREDGSPYPECECPVYKAFKNGTVNHVRDEIFWKKDGTSFSVAYTSTPILEDGKIIGAVLTFWDITERKRGEKERALLATAVKESRENIVIADRYRTILYINPAFERSSGYSCEELVGKKLRVFRSSKHDDAFYQKVKETLDHGKGDVWMGAMINIGKNGREFELEGTISPIRNSSGETTHFVMVGHDMSYLRKLEKDLVQAQKMEAIGTLAGGIAHDFNNILTGIIGYTEIALFNLSEGISAQNALKEVLKAGNRAKDLVSQILTFSRQSERKQAAVQVSYMVRDTLKLLRSALPTTIEIRHAFAVQPEETVVIADPTHIHQILMNLCTNANHAMCDTGGILSVYLSKIEIGSSGVSRYPDLKPGAYVKLTVGDTGCGIDESIIERIFEPYFTTKDLNEGTGLGLSVVMGIVKTYGGAITVHSKQGQGTAFEVLLPRAEIKPEKKNKTIGVIPTGSEHILFVDDDNSIIDMGQKALERLGYRVTTKINSLEALETFLAQPDIFDLLITDMTMPGITGKELAIEIKGIRHDIPIILCTGFSEQINKQQASEIGIQDYIMKPYSIREIATAIRKALDKKQCSG